MVAEQNNSSLVLKLGVALFGCFGLIGAVGIGATLYYQAQVQAALEESLVGESGPLTVDATIEGDTYTIRSAGEGLSRFIHHGDCRQKEAGLTLQYLELDYPFDYEVRSICADSNYVTVMDKDDSGDVQHLIGVGYANGQLSLDDPIVEQLVEMIQRLFSSNATTRPMSNEPFSARGTKLISRSQFLKVHTRLGPYREGEYLNHIVLVPGPNAQGVSILSMKRIESDLDTARSEQAQVLTALIDSIGFSE